MTRHPRDSSCSALFAELCNCFSISIYIQNVCTKTRKANGAQAGTQMEYDLRTRMRRAERRNLRMEQRILLRRRRVLRRTRKLHRQIIKQSLHTYKASLVFLLIFRKKHVDTAVLSISKPGLHSQAQTGKF